MPPEESVKKPSRGYTFKVHSPDVGTLTVSILVDPDGFIKQISGGAALLPLLESAPELPGSRLGYPLRESAMPGITLVPNDDGSMTPVVTEKAQRDMHFFLEGQPCWFQGCEELMRSYHKEIADALADPDCPSCYQGVIMRKYGKLLANLNTDGPIPPRPTSAAEAL